MLGRQSSFVNRRHLVLTGAGFALVLLSNSRIGSVWGRIPWAATSNLHYVDAVVAKDNYWVAAGALAMKRSPSSDVRDFARTLWEGSIQHSRELKSVLMKAQPNIVLPTHISTRYMFLIDELAALGGAAFDRRFIVQQIASLKEVLDLSVEYQRIGDDEDLKDFAARSVPKIMMWLDRILEIDMHSVRLASP